MKWVNTQNSGWINLGDAFQLIPTKPENKEEWQVEIVFLHSEKFYRVLWQDGFGDMEQAQNWINEKMKWCVNG
jgi:hypothetical protein